MAARPRIGRYANPYLTVECHRDPPGDARCEPVRVETEDRAASAAWLYSRGGEDTVVCLMHPRADFSRHYAVPALVEAGFAVFCQNSRWLGSDSALIHEQVLLDVAAARSTRSTRARRSRPPGNVCGIPRRGIRST